MLAYISNIDIGHDKSSTKLVNNKQREHHQILTKALQELQEVCDRGGVEITLAGKNLS